jgi:flagellar protein FlgJ
MSLDQNANISGALAIDAKNLEQLKLQAKRDPKSAIGAASKQFESVFLNMVLKSMREATPQDSLMGSEQTKFYTSMLDQQLAQHLATRGTGLAEAMARQLSAGVGAAGAASSTEDALPGSAADGISLPAVTPAPQAQTRGLTDPALAKAFNAMRMQAAEIEDVNVSPSMPAAPVAKTRESVPRASTRSLDHAGRAAATPATSAAAASRPTPVAPPPDGAAATGTSLLAKTRDFVSRIWSHAVDAARAIGIRPQFMVGQAALESGWGQHEIRKADGTRSHNLFGVKAGRDWTGPVVEKTTTEYVNGVAQKTTAKFRVYSSYAESFQDYARLLQGNSRYSSVLNKAQDAAGFARGLQKAGYATDPTYANKLIRVINGPSLKQALNDTPPAQAAARIDVVS